VQDDISTHMRVCETHILEVSCSSKCVQKQSAHTGDMDKGTRQTYIARTRSNRFFFWFALDLCNHGSLSQSLKSACCAVVAGNQENAHLELTLNTRYWSELRDRAGARISVQRYPPRANKRLSTKGACCMLLFL